MKYSTCLGGRERDSYSCLDMLKAPYKPVTPDRSRTSIHVIRTKLFKCFIHNIPYTCIPSFTSLPPSLSTARRRRNLRRRPRSRYSMGGGASSILPRRGIVHFSSMIELRAAAVEMKDYRMISTLSRSTGFGQTQSVHYLK